MAKTTEKGEQKEGGKRSEDQRNGIRRWLCLPVFSLLRCSIPHSNLRSLETVLMVVVIEVSHFSILRLHHCALGSSSLQAVESSPPSLFPQYHPTYASQWTSSRNLFSSLA
jgi:hypothetical protein